MLVVEVLSLFDNAWRRLSNVKSLVVDVEDLGPK